MDTGPKDLYLNIMVVDIGATGNMTGRPLPKRRTERKHCSDAAPSYFSLRR